MKEKNIDWEEIRESPKKEYASEMMEARLQIWRKKWNYEEMLEEKEKVRDGEMSIT